MSDIRVKKKIKELRLITPAGMQRDVLDSLSKHKYVIVNVGRQSGKSTIAWNYILYRAQIANSVNIWVSRWYKQTKKVFDTICKALHGYPHVVFNKSELSISFKNGSVIKFYSAQNYEAIRGETCDTVVCDEFALFPQSAWTEVISHTIATKPNAKCLFLSTPRGRGWYFDLWKNAKSSSVAYRTWDAISAPSSVSPYVSKEWLDNQRETLSDNVYRQEILAEFVDDTGSLFENVQACANSEKKLTVEPGEYFIGIDVGFKIDYTVVSVLNKNYQMVDFLRLNGETHSIEKAAADISKLISSYSNFYPTTVYIETNKYDTLATLLKQRGVRLVEFNTTHKSKTQIIENLVHLFKSKKISIFDDPVIKDELYTYEYSYSNNGSLTFNAKNGSHDDCVMSLAIAAHAISQPTVGVQNFYF
jgi:hypothetical protein